MSRLYRSRDDYRNRWELGSTVRFDSSCGDRLTGTIVRVYFGNPAAIHVEVDGRRYDVDVNEDNPEMV